MMKKTKFCNRCKTEKSAKEFSSRGGFEKHLLGAFCKKCRTKAATEWREKNRERFNAYHVNYRNTKANA